MSWAIHHDNLSFQFEAFDRASLTAVGSRRVNERCKRGLLALALNHPMIIRRGTALRLFLS
jgi:hypothetical protein